LPERIRESVKSTIGSHSRDRHESAVYSALYRAEPSGIGADPRADTRVRV
jgi:hypothetical protein